MDSKLFFKTSKSSGPLDMNPETIVISKEIFNWGINQRQVYKNRNFLTLRSPNLIWKM